MQMKKILTIIIGVFLYSNIIGQNLISNSNFENNGQLNCQSWYDGNGLELLYLCDTILPDPAEVSFVQDAPNGGGNWCMMLTAGWCPTYGIAKTFITGQVDTNIFELKVWMKSPNWQGAISLGLIHQNQFSIKKTIVDSPFAWTQYTLIDTLTTQLTDTIYNIPQI